MKRHSLFLVAIIISLLLALSGCGGGGAGAPGAGGSGDTGVLINPELIAFFPSISYEFDQEKCEFTTISGAHNYDVDIDTAGDHRALLVVRTSVINTATIFQPGALYIEKYTIKYISSTDSIGAPPIETYTGYQTIYVPVPTLDDLKKEPPVNIRCTLMPQPRLLLVDDIRKQQYTRDILSGRYSYRGNYLNNYTAIYKFEGKNIFGKSFDFTVTRDFTIGDFTP